MDILGILLATIVSQVIGMIWYGPLFGKKWIKAMGKSMKDFEKAKKDMGKTYGLSTLTGFVMAVVMSITLDMLGSSDLMTNLTFVFLVWLGFVVSTHYLSTVFEERKMDVFYLSVGYQLVVILSMGVIFTLL